MGCLPGDWRLIHASIIISSSSSAHVPQLSSCTLDTRWRRRSGSLSLTHVSLEWSYRSLASRCCNHLMLQLHVRGLSWRSLQVPNAGKIKSNVFIHRIFQIDSGVFTIKTINVKIKFRKLQLFTSLNNV